MTPHEENLSWYISAINADLVERLGCAPLVCDQLDVLTDPARIAEALDMLDDLQTRVGVSAYWIGELSAYLEESK